MTNLDAYKLYYEDTERKQKPNQTKPYKLTQSQIDSIGLWASQIILVMFMIFMHFATKGS